MLLSNLNLISQKSSIIPITKNNTTLEKINKINEYGLKQNCFDPSKSSPPNDFILKLNMRMSIYNNIYLQTNLNSLDKE
jgi:hypothetical protein